MNPDIHPVVRAFSRFNFDAANPPLRPPVLLLSGADISALLTPVDDLAAAHAAFSAIDNTVAPMPLHLAVPGGSFHGKAALFCQDGRIYAVLKFNANFPGNPAAHALPTIQGALLLFDAKNGALLAIMDSAEITRRRTAAASVLAAKRLAREGASRLAICGCGLQGRAHLEMFGAHFALASVALFDRDAMAAERLAADARERYGLNATASSLAEAVAGRDIVVTVTPSQEAFLFPGMVDPGTFIAAAGADHPEKSEIVPALMAGARRVFDSIAQCRTMGDLHHAIKAGLVDAQNPGVELADVLGRRVVGRTAADDIVVFDSTGMGIQDAASAVKLYCAANAKPHP